MILFGIQSDALKDREIGSVKRRADKKFCPFQSVTFPWETREVKVIVSDYLERLEVIKFLQVFSISGIT